MWMRAQSIFKTVDDYIKISLSKGSSDILLDQLMTLLRKDHALFIDLLNSKKSMVHRSKLDKSSETVELESGETIKIDEGLKSEAIIVSDLFNCNEFDALELVITGELQMQRFPFLSRGLCAVVCYYDSHRFITAALKALAEFRVDEDAEKSPELHEHLNRLLSDNTLIKRLIEILQNKSVQSELQCLHQPHVNGLGGPRHQEILRELIEETLENCSKTLYLICSSWRLEIAPPFLNELFVPLKKLQPATPFRSTYVSLWISSLILISPHNLQNMRCARDLLMAFYNEVMLEDWQDSCLQASLQFAVVVSYNWLNVRQHMQEVLGGFTIKEDDLLEKAVDGLAFQFIRKCIVAVPKFKENLMAFAMVDTLIKNFIAHFGNQVILLQHVGETELQYVEDMLECGQLHRPRLHFENLIRCIADLYDGDAQHLNSLSLQFCCSEREELVKFLKNGRRLISPVLQVAYLDMLKSICKCRDSACFIFGLVSHNALSTAEENTLCWDHFWRALHDYLAVFKQVKVRTSGIMRLTPGQCDSIQQIPQTELAGLVAWIQLAETVVKNDPLSRRHFRDNGSWSCIETTVNLVTSGIPIVLKGALFRFLAAMAIDEYGALKIWATLLSFSVLSEKNSGKLIGLQVELETRECSMKCYDSSLGFLHLIKALLLYTKNVDTRHLLYYLQFIVKSVISQFADRSYESVAQMWNLCSVACDALYNFLHRYAITAESILNAEPQIVVLTQIVNDSPAFRSLAAVLCTGVDYLKNLCPRSTDHEKAVLSVLRLLDVCVSLHAPLADAVRATDSSIIISTLDSLFLSTSNINGSSTIVTTVAAYLVQFELFPKHAYHIMSILRELCGCHPSLQPRLVQSLSPLAVELIESCARLTSVKMFEIEASSLDAPYYHGVDKLSTQKLRGETVRLFLEVLSSSVESNPNSTNLAYFFCGFKMSDLASPVGETSGELHLVDLLMEMASSNAPLSLPFSALFEPTLRFILRLVSGNSDFSAAVLKFFRSNYDLVYRLVSSPLFMDVNDVNNKDEYAVWKNLRITIQGLVLHVSAIELSLLLRSRHYSQSERYIHLMLSQRTEMGGETSSSTPSYSNKVGFGYTPNDRRTEEEWPTLWKLLRTKIDITEAEIPPMEMLNNKKLQNILSLCLRPTAANVQQCDIEHLDWLLHREFSVVIDETELGLQPEFSSGIHQDANHVLHYCISYNLKTSAEASLRQLVSGWLSFVNVLTIFCPVPFFTFDAQHQYLLDAFYLLINYASDIQMDAKLSSAVSQCLLRLTASICMLLQSLVENINAFRSAITDVVDVLIRFLIQPDKRSMQTKLDLYTCISLILNYSSKPLTFKSTEQKEILRCDDDFFLGTVYTNIIQQDVLRAAVIKYGYELVSVLSKDICDSPHKLRVSKYVF
ncbi:unnamed protein product [Thelazia callipaeda]|uniref:Rif1_N domain-containing protein n=1 Tax=Thelazia callipaeda TaxID=103827 RepID=A0A0N5CPZ8_THECL|nr:unnamed protein product [Thelazia callipaeda]